MVASAVDSAQYSISQVLALTKVPKSTIRFWERSFPEFLEIARTKGRQRRYTQADVEMIQKIDLLVNTELYTLAGVKKKLIEAKGQKVDLQA